MNIHGNTGHTGETTTITGTVEKQQNLQGTKNKEWERDQLKNEPTTLGRVRWLLGGVTIGWTCRR